MNVIDKLYLIVILLSAGIRYEIAMSSKIRIHNFVSGTVES